MWNELTPEEWDWLEAYRHLFGTAEDRLRRYLAWMVHLLWPHGERMELDEIERLMNPFSVIAEPDDDGSVTQDVSPDQAAMMTTMFLRQHGR